MKSRPAIYMSMNLQNSAAPSDELVEGARADAKRAKREGMEVWAVVTAPAETAAGMGENGIITNPRAIDKLCHLLGVRIPAKNINVLLVKQAPNVFDIDTHEPFVDFLRDRDPWLVGIGGKDASDAIFKALYGASETLSQRSRVRALADRMDGPMRSNQLLLLRDDVADVRVTSANGLFNEHRDSSIVPPRIGLAGVTPGAGSDYHA